MLNELEASARAMEYVAEMKLIDGNQSLDDFKDSSHMAIESIRHSDDDKARIVGVGFVRNWNRIRTVGALGAALNNTSAKEVRTTKTVVIDDVEGKLLSYR